MDRKGFGVLYLNKNMIDNVKPRNYGGDMIDYVLENNFEGGKLNSASIDGLRKSD